jgi:hypothetical protein
MNSIMADSRTVVQKLFQSRSAGETTFSILLVGPARSTDGTNDFAANNKRKPATDGQDITHSQKAQPNSSGRYGVFKELCRTAEEGRCTSFVNGNLDIASLRAVHLLEVHQFATGVDDGDRHL